MDDDDDDEDEEEEEEEEGEEGEVTSNYSPVFSSFSLITSLALPPTANQPLCDPGTSHTWKAHQLCIPGGA